MLPRTPAGAPLRHGKADTHVQATRVAAAAAVLLVGILAGCSGEKGSNTTGVAGQFSAPTVGSFVLAAHGGHGANFPLRNGGAGGDITINVAAGHLMLNDGRTLATPATNLIPPSLQADGVVTYAELEAQQAPVIAGGVATFTLVGSGFHLLSGVVLDLSDATYTGGSPTTDVLIVEIISDEAIRIDGRILGTRAGNESVGVLLQSTHDDGLMVLGDIDTRGDAGFDGADVSLVATHDLLALGHINTSGGAATATVDAGDAGDIDISSSDGDVLLLGGSIWVYGGNGADTGGNGGDVVVNVILAANLSFNWSTDARGGSGGDGNGGDGGDLEISTNAALFIHAALVTHGGFSDDGNGGEAGLAELFAISITGWMIAHADGGNSNDGDGGNAGAMLVECLDVHDALLQLYAAGGRGENGGNGGGLELDVFGNADYTDLWVDGPGGSGVMSGGNGGVAVLFAQGPGTIVSNTGIVVYSDGGAATDAAGIAGNAGGGGFTVAGSPPNQVLSTNSVRLEVTARGGSGATAGSGGEAIIVGTGNVHGTIIANLQGGAGSVTGAAGGNGGECIVVSEGGSVDVALDIGANGGAGLGAAGGQGGTLTAVAYESVNDLGGPLYLRGRFTSQGGPSNTDGGVGGTADLEAGISGPVILEALNINLRGGAGNLNGGAGGIFGILSYQSMTFISGNIDVGGGASSAGAGGDAGSMDLAGDFGQFNIGGQLLGVGGNGDTSGGDGASILIDGDANTSGDSAHISLHSTIDVRGGIASAGAGGTGGDVFVSGTAAVGLSGVVAVSGTIRADGGSGTTGGDGGEIRLVTENIVTITGTLLVNGAGNGSGGFVALGDSFDGVADTITLGSTARIHANGDGTGVAGTISMDALGTGGASIIEHPAADLQTLDGNTTDQSATNIIRD